MIEAILPVLLNHGINSTVSEIRIVRWVEYNLRDELIVNKYNLKNGLFILKQKTSEIGFWQFLQT